MLNLLDAVATLPPDDGWKNLFFIALVALFFILGCVAIIIRNERTLKPRKQEKNKPEKKDDNA